jgi:trigger factor
MATTAPAAEPTADLVPNTVTVEETSATSRRITVTVPADSVTAKIEQSFGALQLEAAVPGFRKGRAPRGLLEKRFGSSVVKETKGQLIGDAYSKALEAKNIRPVGEPDLTKESIEKELERGKPFTFVVDVEVVPEFELPPLDGIPVRRPVVEVTAEHIDQELLRQSYRWGTPSRIDGPFQHLDRMVGKATVKIDGAEGTFFETDQALVVVPAKEDEGKGQLLGLMIDDLERHLLGKSVGIDVTVKTVGPEQHEREEIRGKPLTIDFHVAAAERITPATQDELAARFGLESHDMLREQVKFALEQRRDAEQKAAEREQVFEWLQSKVDFPLPAKLSERQAARTLNRQRMDMIYRGMDEDQVERNLAQLRGVSEEQAKNRLKLFFILSRLAEQFGVSVTEQEVNGRVFAIAQQQGLRPDQVRAELQRTDSMNDVVLQIREHKTADRLLEKAAITDVPAEEWNKEVQAKAADGKTADGRTGASATKGGKKKA